MLKMSRIFARLLHFTNGAISSIRRRSFDTFCYRNVSKAFCFHWSDTLVMSSGRKTCFITTSDSDSLIQLTMLVNRCMNNRAETPQVVDSVEARLSSVLGIDLELHEKKTNTVTSVRRLFGNCEGRGRSLGEYGLFREMCYYASHDFHKSLAGSSRG